ncbi:MAG: hypothetical protein P1V35_10515, partial [Planctomycetota bacterium]|nr:hypothetical protein [Planctomycetota bacterium]
MLSEAQCALGDPNGHPNPGTRKLCPLAGILYATRKTRELANVLVAAAFRWVMEAVTKAKEIERLLAEGEWIRGLAAGLLGDPNRADDLAQETYLA